MLYILLYVCSLCDMKLSHNLTIKLNHIASGKTIKLLRKSQDSSKENRGDH